MSKTITKDHNTSTDGKQQENSSPGVSHPNDVSKTITKDHNTSTDGKQQENSSAGVSHPNDVSKTITKDHNTSTDGKQQGYNGPGVSHPNDESKTITKDMETSIHGKQQYASEQIDSPTIEDTARITEVERKKIKQAGDNLGCGRLSEDHKVLYKTGIMTVTLIDEKPDLSKPLPEGVEINERGHAVKVEFNERKKIKQTGDNLGCGRLSEDHKVLYRTGKMTVTLIDEKPDLSKPLPEGVEIDKSGQAVKVEFNY